jgi:hypothetical protein
MAKWYEAANEASFKATDGGYVFQSPNPWIFARPRYYLVNDTQKAAISERMRHWRILMLSLMMVTFAVAGSFIAFVTLSPATFVGLFRPVIQGGMGFFVLVLSLLMAAVVVPMVLVPHIYLMRGLRRLLGNAPRTSERITVADQLPKIAASLSSKVLVVGMISGVVMIAGAILLLVDAFFEGHLARSIVYLMPLPIFGGLTTAYFVYLAKLKAQLRRSEA